MRLVVDTSVLVGELLRKAGRERLRDNRLRQGGPADVVVYGPGNLAVGPNEVVRDSPGGEWRRIQRVSGYRSVIVNGAETISEDTQTETYSGQLLRHGG